MLVTVLSVALAAAPAALVLLLGLGAAVWVFLRSRVAGAVLAVAIVLLGLAEVLGAGADIFMSTPMFWSTDPGTAEVAAGGIAIAVSLVRGLGIVVLFAAACLGPSPRSVEAA